ncbi:hypothetical protein EOPP23_05390 [Endozoicomonas sp. OPT23]|uniref:hypothetical protein n=1 Tax=Endozoicomonas sp. OPT23 TaxID=2072845 RepID=UPI00129A4887|nr:hypothetical protein [Endozoicomonas sp. OPT23]MRI32417.1 hypothetical protein [Endozoicomonas sp. OPT23]
MKTSPITRFCLGLIGVLCYSSATAAPSSYCTHYSPGSEHRILCDQYDASNVIEVPENSNLTEFVNSTDTGKLLIIPASQRDNPYPLAGPLKLASGTSLLAGNDGVSGFFDLGWAADFSIGTDPVYCMISLGEGSTVTGVRIDDSNMSPENQLYFNQQGDKIKAYIYSNGKSRFKVSWGSFITPLKLDGAIYADNDIHRTNIVGNTDHIARYNWIESRGASHGIRIATAKTTDSGLTENVRVSNNVIQLSKLPDDSFLQTAVHTKNGCGSIHDNTIVFGNDILTTSQFRKGIVLENQATPEVSGFAMISQSVNPHSQDSGFEFLQSEGKTLRARLSSGSIDSRIQTTPTTFSGKGILIGDIRQSDKPVFTQTESEFFSQSFPQAGTCPVPASSLWGFESSTSDNEDTLRNAFCGLRLTRTDFQFSESYSADISNSSNCSSNSGLIGGLVCVSALSAIEFCVIAGGCIWKFYLAPRYISQEFNHKQLN